MILETSLGFDFVAGLWDSKQKPRRGKDEDLRFSAQRMWVLRDDGVDAVCVCVMPLSEFPIVFSYPHYAQRTLIESCKTKCRVCILFLSLFRTTRFKLKPKTPSRHLCSDMHVSLQVDLSRKQLGGGRPVKGPSSTACRARVLQGCLAHQKPLPPRNLR